MPGDKGFPRALLGARGAAPLTTGLAARGNEHLYKHIPSSSQQICRLPRETLGLLSALLLFLTILQVYLVSHNFENASSATLLSPLTHLRQTCAIKEAPMLWFLK